ncbi:hypothetical protein HYV82_02005 [Candidatus Woesearchaeota archaeon]|nr:hypothetical protein [Candidatus Woesearchaeota archaeon]
MIGTLVAVYGPFTLSEDGPEYAINWTTELKLAGFLGAVRTHFPQGHLSGGYFVTGIVDGHHYSPRICTMDFRTRAPLWFNLTGTPRRYLTAEAQVIIPDGLAMVSYHYSAKRNASVCYQSASCLDPGLFANFAGATTTLSADQIRLHTDDLELKVEELVLRQLSG